MIGWLNCQRKGNGEDVDDESRKTISGCVGKLIVGAELRPYLIVDEDSEGEGIDGFVIEFETGEKLWLWDDGRLCCEKRYMTTDDDPHCLINTRLVMVYGTGVDRDYGESCCYEAVFITVQTDKCSVKLVNHNEDNGQYAGFALRATLEGA